MEIIDLSPDDNESIYRVADLLRIAFKDLSPDSWPDIETALSEVQELFGADKISRIAVSEKVPVGWIGATSNYNGNSWELHPLVVHPQFQNRGIGRALVADLEKLIASKGGITLYVWTDDETGLTSLGKKELYPHILKHLEKITVHRTHPFGFYIHTGFYPAGVLPDANGPGKPDILLVKKLDNR
jgi:aminoglycoside 6'-N-acetyltransferase I